MATNKDRYRNTIASMLLKPEIPMQVVLPWTLTEAVKKCPVAMHLHMIIEGVEQSSNFCHSFQVDHPNPGGVRPDLNHSIKTSWLSFYIAVGFSEDVGNAMWHILERKAHRAAQSMQPALPTVHFRLTMQYKCPSSILLDNCSVRQMMCLQSFSLANSLVGCTK